MNTFKTNKPMSQLSASPFGNFKPEPWNSPCPASIFGPQSKDPPNLNTNIFGLQSKDLFHLNTNILEFQSKDPFYLTNSIFGPQSKNPFQSASTIFGPHPNMTSFISSFVDSQPDAIPESSLFRKYNSSYDQPKLI